ncbi:MAG TPA: hypothetical protein VII24_10620 [Pseudolabrys sp.]|jgi:hypothetical protein
MPPIAFARRFSAALAFMYFFAAAPATAEVEKFMRHCDGKLCAYYRASVTIPEGWVEDPEASRELGVQMLLPKGQSFEAAPAKIYVLVRYNREKQPVSAIARDTYRDWRERAKNAKVAKLSDVARQNGKAAFERHQFEAPKLAEQGFEVTSLAADSDKDGNGYVVVVCLSANTREARVSAEAAYMSILTAY